ncbi:MAG: tetratricopeptide repeat protein [Lewinellaceae bacterium]|nr:tetratricopeptide repeat protein [Lewinellaceae bacterium]
MKTKLQCILETLSAKEMGEISDNITSPFLGGKQKHKQFLDKFLSADYKLALNFSVKDRLLMSELVKMIEKYIFIKSAMEDNTYKHKLLLSHFRKVESQKLFSEYFKSIEQQLNGTDCKNADYYQLYSDILFEKWQFDQLQNRFDNADVDDMFKFKDIAMIGHKLLQMTTIASQTSLISKEIDYGVFTELERYIIENQYLEIPSIALYYYVYKMITEPAEISWFDQFAKSLEDHKDAFPFEEVKSFYLFAINYCIRKYNNGLQEFGFIILDYYNIALSKNLLLQNGNLSKNTYRNINTLAIRLGRFEDALKISNDYIDLLRDDDKKSAYNFNMANIHYATKQYDEALELLQQVEFDDHLSNLFAKSVLLKIYFETNSYRSLDSHLDAMQVYLTRKKIIGYHKINYSNLIKFTKRLLALSPYDKTAKEKLKDDIASEKQIADKKWLLSQLD